MDEDRLRRLARRVTEAHIDDNTYTIERRRRTLHHHTIILKDEESDNEAGGGDEAASPTTDRTTDARSVLWYNMALRMTPAVIQVAEFAKRLPGFWSLVIDDRMILVTLGFFEVWLTRITRLSTPECIVFDDGTAFAHSQLKTIYDTQFATGLMNYIWNIATLQLTEEEMALYTGTLLLFPERAGLNDPDIVSGLYHTMNETLLNVVLINGSDGGGSSSNGIDMANARFDALVAARNDVRALGMRHNTLLSWCREHRPRLSLPVLISEVFEIPKIKADDGISEADRAAADRTAADPSQTNG